MSGGKILHICVLDKFIPPFIDFVEEHFGLERHTFYLIGDIGRYPVKQTKSVIHVRHRYQYLAMLLHMHLSEKIMLHSIFARGVVKLLAATPWLLRKCYWVMWGGDLYHYQNRERNVEENAYEKTRAYVIKRICHFVTYFSEEHELAKKWYGANGEQHKCFAYLSNVYKDIAQPPEPHEGINIQIGNSADPSNRHIDILNRLIRYRNEKIKIFAPLSYGDMTYAKKVIEHGKAMFGDQFIPMPDFLPFDEYQKHLSCIDVAIFNHWRQQALGNILTLLGMGKKVYMCSDTTSWHALKSLGLHVFDVDQLDLCPLDSRLIHENHEIVAGTFSEANLLEQLRSIFESGNAPDTHRRAN